MLVEVQYSYVAKYARLATRERVSMASTGNTVWFRTPAHEGFCAIIQLGEDAGRIKGMFVHPECRRQGLATGMVKDCVKYARGRNWSRIEALAYRPEIYTRLGFRQIGDRRPNGAVRVVLQLKEREDNEAARG